MVKENGGNFELCLMGLPTVPFSPPGFPQCSPILVVFPYSPVRLYQVSHSGFRISKLSHHAEDRFCRVETLKNLIIHINKKKSQRVNQRWHRGDVWLKKQKYKFHPCTFLPVYALSVFIKIITKNCHIGNQCKVISAFASCPFWFDGK